MLFDVGKYGENIAFEHAKGIAVTYNDLAKLTKRVEQKIGSRKLVCLLASNTVGALAYYISFLNSKNVVLLLDAGMAREDLEKYLKTYQPDYICKPQDQEYVLSAYEPEIKKELYKELALLLPTSGSTGAMKLVRQSYRNIEANTKAIITYLQIKQSDRPILSLPMSYTYGLSIVHTHIAMGASIFLTDDKICQKAFWNFCREKNITSFSGVPYSYEVLDRFRFFERKECISQSRMEYSQKTDQTFIRKEEIGLKTLTQAGGHLDNALQEKIIDYAIQHKIRFYVMYGQTEATARMSYVPYQKLYQKEKIGSVGIPIPGTRMEITDETGCTIEKPFQSGEIVFYGENVSLGYADCLEDLKLQDTNQGRLQTGDIGYKDEDGYFYITGRKNRFVKICGKRMSLDEIEQKMKSKFYGVDCAITGNDTCLQVYIDQDRVEEVTGYLQKKFRLGRSQVQVDVLQQIPKNAAGKVQYTALSKH